MFVHVCSKNNVHFDRRGTYYEIIYNKEFIIFINYFIALSIELLYPEMNKNCILTSNNFVKFNEFSWRFYYWLNLTDI